IFATYVRTFVDQHIHEPDNKLPLTGLSVGSLDPSPSDQTLRSLPSARLPTPQIRSPFVALSGHTDAFDSIASLCQTVRSGVFLEESVIPHLPLDTVAPPLNAYLYDFYMHGNVDALETANGVRKSDVWFLLNDFSLVLSTVIASLANYMKIPEGGTDMEDLVGGGDEGNNRDEEALEAADSGYGSSASSVTEQGKSVSSASLPGAAAGGKGKKKEKVEDSWEVEADADAKADEEAEAWDDGSESDADEAPPTTAKELEKGFVNIYKAFTGLKREFDEKFRAMFA
ncbi:MAG: hypothetical protein Q9193_007337, partial [Seirophora villosa]